MVNLTRKMIMLTLEIPVQVGRLSANMEYYLNIYEGEKLGKPAYDTDWTDITEIYCDGVEITDWQKFVQFHKEMGINYAEQLQAQAKLQLTKKVIKKLINESNF